MGQTKGGNPQHSGTSDGIYNLNIKMETKLAELDGKFKALNLFLGKTSEAVSAGNKATLERKEQ